MVKDTSRAGNVYEFWKKLRDWLGSEEVLGSSEASLFRGKISSEARLLPKKIKRLVFKRRKFSLGSREIINICIVFCTTLTFAFLKQDKEENYADSIVDVIREDLESIAIASVGVIYVLEASERRKRGIYEAWQVINSSGGQTGDGGRSEALMHLCFENELLDDVLAPNANLSEINLEKAKLSGANFENTKFTKADLTKATLKEANLRNTRLDKAILKGANLTSSILEESVLNGANLENSDLSYANLSNTELNGVNFQKSILVMASLTKTVMLDANFEAAELAGADFRESRITDSSFRGANIEDVNFEGAILISVDFEDAIGWTEEQFSNAQYLYNVDFPKKGES